MLIERAYAVGELADPVKDLLNKLAVQIISPIVSLMFGVAMLYFLYGVYLYIVDAGTDKRKEREMHLIFGVIGLTIMVCVWGILQFVCNNVACQ